MRTRERRDKESVGMVEREKRKGERGGVRGKEEREGNEPLDTEGADGAERSSLNLTLMSHFCDSWRALG